MPLNETEEDLLMHILIDDEELRLKPYLDCCGKYWIYCRCENRGKLTIGVGRNLDDVGISESEAMLLLNNNIQRAVFEAERSLPWFRNLNSVRKVVILSMVFNMGLDRFMSFKMMTQYLAQGDFGNTAKEMLKSKWANQVGERARRLSVAMETGFF